MRWYRTNLRKRYFSKFFLTFFLAFILIVLIESTLLFLEANSYRRALIGNESAVSISKKAENLSRRYDDYSKILSLPIIKQTLSFFDFDFTPIRDESRVLISSSPTLLGFDRPKKYLVVVQNNAEARGTGGILGAYAIVEINGGNVKVLKASSNANFPSESKTPIEMPKEFRDLYRNDPGIFQNSNLSPHFPYGAEIWMSLWKNRFDEELDGVIAIDPVAISEVLGATGPINTPNGEVYDQKNVVEKTLKDLYKRYEFDNDGRKQFLVTLMNSTFLKLESRQFSKVQMIRAFQKMVLERRLLIYTKDRESEKDLSETRLGGALNLKPNKEFRVVVLNTDASKLDYYLDRKVVISSEDCGLASRTRVEVQLTNSVVHAGELPDYVLTRADKGKPKSLKTGQHRFQLFLYGPVNGEIIGALRSNQLGSPPLMGKERNRPLLAVDVDLAPGQSETITVEFRGGVGNITYIDQPLVKNTIVQLRDSCGKES